MAKSVFDRRGQRVNIGGILGKGGEGSVFEICNAPTLVAKLYHKPLSPEHATKLTQMVGLQSERLLQLAAWPVTTLHEQPNRPVVGLVMPKADGKAIHTLYGPKNRLAEFPNADWRFLVHAASNIARAFEAIHSHGHVIGDVNHGNLFVSQQATVMLIDCDSFQITHNGHNYLCEVGIDTHTPPELQGCRFKNIVRTQNHDAFGLGVLIFQLLFMGRHPFAGGFLGTGDMPIAKAIKECRFAYGQNAKARQMQQPPATLALEAVSPFVATLFEKAFSSAGAQGSARPGPKEWIAGLTALANAIKPCQRHNGHFHCNSLPDCPWCAIEMRSGVALFNIVFNNNTRSSSRFDIASVWQQIASVPVPPELPPLPPLFYYNFPPTAGAAALGREFRKGLAVITSALGINSRRNLARRSAAATLTALTQRWQEVALRWQAERTTQEFQAMLRVLSSKRNEYNELPNLRHKLLQSLASSVRQKQLERFLDSHLIYHATINNIGPGRKATLQSYGIETANDVDLYTVLAIPGFGPSLCDNLISWRRTVERTFVFDPSKGVNPNDVATVERDIQTQRGKLELEIMNGLSQLRQASQQVKTRRETLWTNADQIMRQASQAKADLDAM